ncbi:hypothetical protein WM15_17080 [Burkholderia ubonensis]|nr:hypothetical protein WM15_17080 [Burkholderia ubonensis]
MQRPHNYRIIGIIFKEPDHDLVAGFRIADKTAAFCGVRHGKTSPKLVFIIVTVQHIQVNEEPVEILRIVLVIFRDDSGQQPAHLGQRSCRRRQPTIPNR